MNQFIINKTKIISNYNNFKKAGAVYYSVKANDNIEIIKILNEVFAQNDKFAISNLSQLHLLTDLNISPDRATLVNPFYSVDELETFYDFGVRDFVFEDVDTFTKLMRHQDIIPSVRISISEIFDNETGFVGASLSDTINMLTMGCSLSIYCPESVRKNEYIEDCLTAAKVFGAHTLRLSGIDAFDAEKFNKFSNNECINIITEPGQYLVGNAIDYKCEIEKIKQIKNNKYIILNTSLFAGCIDHAVYNRNFAIMCEDTFFSYKELPGTQKYVLCGNSSDSTDIIGTIYLNEKEIKMINSIGYVIFKNVGAHFDVLKTSYGKQIKNEIILKD